MTHQERAERVEELRRYHADLTPHYDDCGCGECNAHILIVELDYVKAEAYRAGYRGSKTSVLRAVREAEAEIKKLRDSPRCPTCGADIEGASEFPAEEDMMDTNSGQLYIFVHCVNGHEVTTELNARVGSAEIEPQVFRRFQVLALVDDVLGEALTLLKEVEWAGTYRYSERACLFCLRPERGNVLTDEGHASDCRLKTFLSDAK